MQAEVDHGPVLVGQVHQGLLDAAIITIADQAVLPHGLQTTPLGASSLVLVMSDGTSPPGQGRTALAGHEVLYSSIDLAGQHLHEALSSLGAHPQPGPTIEASLRIARHRKILALVPALAARWWNDPGDTVLPSLVPGKVALHLVTRPPQHTLLARPCRH
ncbi:LysR substrate-binding domain-containing protein [Streptomyces sp. NPDC059218]|uniref:LysR substrate-binding domain-containing protein n=1 Tax=unclassified Streptomyces TaxID=2593676 RepID=UPI0036A5DCA9